MWKQTFAVLFVVLAPALISNATLCEISGDCNPEAKEQSEDITSLLQVKNAVQVGAGKLGEVVAQEEKEASEKEDTVAQEEEEAVEQGEELASDHEEDEVAAHEEEEATVPQLRAIQAHDHSEKEDSRIAQGQPVTNNTAKFCWWLMGANPPTPCYTPSPCVRPRGDWGGDHGWSVASHGMADCEAYGMTNCKNPGGCECGQWQDTRDKNLCFCLGPGECPKVAPNCAFSLYPPNKAAICAFKDITHLGKECNTCCNGCGLGPGPIGHETRA